MTMDRTDWDRRYAGSELLWTERPNRFLVAEIADLAPGRALDLACGEGRNAVWLAEQGWRVTGIDFSEVAVGKAHRLAALRGVEVDWIADDLLRYEFPAATCDLVIMLYLQLPEAERGHVIRAAASALAPGGTFLLVGHDSRNLEHGYGGPRDPSVLYTADDVVADLDGFEIERAGIVERPVETPEGDEAIALDALVRARRRDA
jgi:SAM-dependent methyltransferase